MRAQADDTAAPQDYHALYDRVNGKQRSAPAATARHGTGSQRLAADVAELVVAFDEATGLPNQVTTRAAGVRLGPPAATAEAAATAFVRSRADLWDLRPEDAGTVEVLSVSRRGLRTVRLLQRAGGVEVFNSDVTVAVNDHNEVLALAGQLFPGAGAAATRARALKDIDAAPAIARAAADLTGTRYDATEFKRTAAAGEGGYSAYQHRRRPSDERPAMERPVRVKPVLFPLGGGELRTRVLPGAVVPRPASVQLRDRCERAAGRCCTARTCAPATPSRTWSTTAATRCCVPWTAPPRRRPTRRACRTAFRPPP